MVQMQELFKWINTNFPQSNARLEDFPSTAATLYVDIGTETFALEYAPEEGYGVSRISTAVFGWEGAEHTFENFENARKFLIELLLNRAG